MPIDILIFAGIAAFLIYRLNNVLGTHHGDEPRSARTLKPQEPAPAPTPVAALPAVAPAAGLAQLDDIVDPDARDRVTAGLHDIVEADPDFDPHAFMQGAGAAFEMIVTAFAAGDLDTLAPLVTPKLYNDFESAIAARARAGHVMETRIDAINRMRIVEAHLGGAMAYITVDYDVVETSVTRDRDGHVVEGDADNSFAVRDVWTFTRDTRADDPNWILIETRAADNA